MDALGGDDQRGAAQVSFNVAVDFHEALGRDTPYDLQSLRNIGPLATPEKHSSRPKRLIRLVRASAWRPFPFVVRDCSHTLRACRRSDDSSRDVSLVGFYSVTQSLPVLSLFAPLGCGTLASVSNYLPLGGHDRGQSRTVVES